MIEVAIKELKQRQQAITEQIQSLQAEAGKLEKALSVLAELSGGAAKAPAAKKPKPTKQPKAPKSQKRKMSAAGRQAIAAAAKARWAALRAKKEGKAAPAPVAAQTAQAGRPQNEIPLMDAVLKVLHPEKAQSIPEIITAVEKAGYVSNSKSFATIIGQTLKKAGEKVIRVRRGQYALNG